MPRKKKDPSGAKTESVVQGVFWLPNDAAWGGFINVRLDDEQKQTFIEWFEEGDGTVHVYLEDILAEGMKVAFAYDRENQCHIVTFTGALVGGSNERYCATSRAGTLTECLALAVWKHVHLAAGDYGSYRPASGKLNNWG